MIEFGKTLRTAREAKGYSTSQLAEITHILPQIIENLEREDFTRIVAPIYGRGFVKLYCESVGLDPQPLVAEFMEIFSGNRPPVIRLKDGSEATHAHTVESDPSVPEDSGGQSLNGCTPNTVSGPEIPAPTRADEQTEAPSPAADSEIPASTTAEPMTFDFWAKDEAPPVKMSAFSRNPKTVDLSRAPQPDALPIPDNAPPAKRDYRLPGHSMVEVPRQYWRFGILIAAAAVILALLFLSCRAIYRATMQVSEPNEKIRETAQQEVKPQTDSHRPTIRSPRKPMSVPPLYID